MLVFYLFVFEPPGLLTIAIVLAGVAGMFMPFVFVHPVRVVKWRAVTIVMLAVWAALRGARHCGRPVGKRAAKIGLAVTALYFLALPFARDTPFADE